MHSCMAVYDHGSSHGKKSNDHTKDLMEELKSLFVVLISVPFMLPACLMDGVEDVRLDLLFHE